MNAYAREKSLSQVAAIIVTYQPNAILLARVLERLSEQVAKIYLIDNTPNTQLEGIVWLEKKWLTQFTAPIAFYPQGKNLGVAKAQNIGIEQAFADQMQDLIFFDQDSSPPKNLSTQLLEARGQLEARGVKVGMIGPTILDEKSHEYSPIIQADLFWVRGYPVDLLATQPIATEYIISSGSLISAGALQEVGLMNESLFIDWVDVEWGLRAQTYGLVNYVTPTIRMDHSIGDDFLRINNRIIYLHSDLRNFYIVRNAAYLVSHCRYKLAWKVTVLVKLPLYILFFTLHAKCEKPLAFKVMIKGLVYGFIGKMGVAPKNLFK